MAIKEDQKIVQFFLPTDLYEVAKSMAEENNTTLTEVIIASLKDSVFVRNLPKHGKKLLTEHNGKIREVIFK